MWFNIFFKTLMINLIRFGKQLEQEWGSNFKQIIPFTVLIKSITKCFGGINCKK